MHSEEIEDSAFVHSLDLKGCGLFSIQSQSCAQRPEFEMGEGVLYLLCLFFMFMAPIGVAMAVTWFIGAPDAVALILGIVLVGLNSVLTFVLHPLQYGVGWAILSAPVIAIASRTDPNPLLTVPLWILATGVIAAAASALLQVMSR